MSLENYSIDDQNLDSSNTSNKETYCFSEVLLSFRFKNAKNLIMDQLNINNLLRNKFESIKSSISPNFDIFLVSETKFIV